MSYVAVNLQCVVFNVDYRLVPEVRAPVPQEDFLDALYYVRDHADELGVDKSKICIAGASGGGWVVVGATNLLAKAGKSNYVKALFC